MADKEVPNAITSNELLKLTSNIVSAHVAHNAVPATDVPQLIRDVHSTLQETATETKKEEERVPAVAIKRSVRPDHLVCLECGKRQRSLKRHLRVAHELNVEDYRQRWNLPSDYPMVAPDYARARSALAKQIGLGRKRAAARPEKDASNGTPATTRRASTGRKAKNGKRQTGRSAGR